MLLIRKYGRLVSITLPKTLPETPNYSIKKTSLIFFSKFILRIPSATLPKHIPLTRAGPGGRFYAPPPLRFFADSGKTAAKFCIPVLASFLHIAPKN